MLHIIVPFLCWLLMGVSPAQGNESLVGAWQFKNNEMEIIADFSADGTFHQVNTSAKGKETYTGRYQLTGQMLYLHPQGAAQPLQLVCRFLDADTLAVTYPSGQTLQWKRLRPRKAAKSPENPLPSPGGKSPDIARIPGGPPPQALPTGKHPALLFQRTWEPKERAYTFLVPKGWKVVGGIFNVDPLKMNGPGNTISPKNDLTVKSDERGTVMLRWIPGWNYADLTYSSTGFSFFKPGSYYQGMPVRLIIPPKKFLLDLLQNTRPQAKELAIVAEDPMPEIVQAYTRSAQTMNQQLQQIGIGPTRFEALAMLVEYTEGSVRFREVLTTAIADARHGAFMWSNDATLVFRAPAQEFAAWKPVIDTIRNSLQMNPQWVAAVTRAMGERAKGALETQRYINKVANEIVENRRRTHAEIRHEQYLFITGQEEYTNPFNGQAERDTSEYRYRWVNNQGDYFYTDENSVDPNKHEEYNTREWKRTPARKR
ncbi:MAG: hypothetical protein NTY64_08035 [Deltaproteobacteria bacterium]|nr:hypothetical protein [Deltaproteobacteria bacterium]